MRTPCTLLLFDGQRTTIYPWSKARALEVVLHGPYLTSLQCEELIKICHWLKEHSEVHSVLLRSSNNFDLFGQGPDWDLVKENRDELNDISSKILTLQKLMFNLPQVFVCDLGLGAYNYSFELALGSQIFLAHEDAAVSLDHARFGLAPGEFTLKRLNKFSEMAYKMSLTGIKTKLRNETFLNPIFYLKDKEPAAQRVLSSIAALAPVVRINLKFGISKELGFITHDFEIDPKIYESNKNHDLTLALDRKSEDEKIDFQTVKDYVATLPKNKSEFNFTNILN